MMGSALAGRCPNCGQGRVFDGWLTVRERCDHCGAVFLRDEGNWIGSTVLAYMLGCAFALVLLFVMWTTGALAHKGSEWIVSGSTVVFLLLVFRPVKGVWVGLLHQWGYVYPDSPDGRPSSGPR
jgi:uncharacterized protein (DUF983 family)